MAQNLPYRPARLYKGKRWYIAYYAAKKGRKELVRVQIKWNRIEDLREREQRGLEMVQQINYKLASGWSPFDENQKQADIFLSEALANYQKRVMRQAAAGDLRQDSIRTYTSYQKLWAAWLEPKIKEMRCQDLDARMIGDYLDHLYNDKGVSARTRNNHLSFIKTFCAWMLERDYIKVNPALKIRRLVHTKKKRILIPSDILQQIWTFLDDQPGYKLICLMEYYTFIRRTEICRLRVKDVHLDKQVIRLPAAMTKNGKDAQVVIPEALHKALEAHIAEAAPTHYLFTSFFGPPGKVGLKPKAISDKWSRVRKALALDKAYQFYSLKDTGITNMLAAGISPILVRDQARHHSLAQTNTYAQSTLNPDEALLKWK